ncbi:MAG: MerR family DNA-binding transcriptional regulator [Actinobacteria bacterium]|nr:MerR family DNA-binding transcriptional regulator [Actinomycetota bacterium]
MSSQKLYGTTEVAAFLGIHPDSLRRAERAGRIPRAQRESVSGHRAYSRDDVDALAALIGLRSEGWPP